MILFKTKNVNGILDLVFKQLVGIEQIRWRWKADENPLILSLYDGLLKGKVHELLHVDSY